MNNPLNQLEIDFIDYISKRCNEPIGEIEDFYFKLRDRLNSFRGKRFRYATSDIQTIYNFFYHPKTEEGVLDAYRSLASIHLLIYLSSSFPKCFSERVQDAMDLLKGKRYTEFFQWGQRYVKSKVIRKQTTDVLRERLTGTPVIVDYGSGIAQLSLDVARKIPSAKVYLVDVETMVLDFAVFRFRKYHCNFEVIKITKDNLYPLLPEHNLCIANEVMEHVYEPLTVYRNIHNMMTMGGILYGNFTDHEKNMLHVSPDLSILRKNIEQEYEKIETKLYKKVR